MSAPPAIVMQRPDRTSDRAEDVNDAQRWQGRPVAALALKTALFLGPLLASLVASRLLYGLVDAPRTLPGKATLWVSLLAVGFVVAILTERWTRRFLPVAMLMRLTMLFPDQAPSRYTVMRAAASPSRLREIADSGSAASDAATQVLGLVAELAQHDRHTRGHSERVRVFADLIAEQLGVGGLDRDKLRWGALIHDIGKLDVPAEILNKNGRPTQDEWGVLQQHPTAGQRRSGALYSWLGEWAGGITEHHEHWNGKGYPARLAGDRISLAGRIVAVADAYETMTASRAYKKPMATAAARQELADCAGAQFDPQVVRAFLEISLPRLMWRVGPLSFLTHLPFLHSMQAATQAAMSTAGAAATPTVIAGLSAAAIVSGVVPSAAAAPDHSPQVSATSATQTADGAESTGPRTHKDPRTTSLASADSVPAAVGSRVVDTPGAGPQPADAPVTAAGTGTQAAPAPAASLAADKAAKDKAAKDKAAADKAAKDKAAKDKAAKDKAAADKAAKDQAAKDKAARDKAEKDRDHHHGWHVWGHSRH